MTLALALLALALALTTFMRPAWAEGSATTIVVTSTGWHTGIAIARADIPVTEIPEIGDFPDAAWIEFGWGDKDFYTDPDAGVLGALRATVPGPAVMHVAGLWGHPSRVFPQAEWAPVALPAEGIDRLIAYLAAGFDRDGAARARHSARGLYAFSRFYPATGEFHLFNTCNTWVAQGLAASGLPIDTDGVNRASHVMEQLAPLAPQGTPSRIDIESLPPPVLSPDRRRD